MVETQTERIPLSELRWWTKLMDCPAFYGDCTKRQKIEWAVKYARWERIDCPNEKVLL